MAAITKMVTFVGEGPAAQVEDFVSHLDGLRRGEDLPRVILLEAESGAGKSRLLREFYERLRSRQPVNDQGEGYWPSLCGEKGGSEPELDAMEGRKVVGPKVHGFTRPPGTVPSFSWLAVNCADAANGSFIDATRLLWPNLRAHLRFLVQGWKRATSSKERFRKWAKTHAKAGLDELGDEASAHALGQLVDSMLGTTVPGLGLAYSGSKAALQTGLETRRLRADIREGGLLDTDPARDTKALAAGLRRVVAVNMPMIIAVEDIHLMDPTLAELLRDLAEKDIHRPILIVGTAWPEGRKFGTYQAWRDELVQRRRARLVTGEAYPALGQTELVEVARQFAPASGDEGLQLIASKWPNPYAMVLALTDPYFVLDFIHEGRLVVKPQDLEDWPTGIKDLYGNRWRELPDTVQRALMIAAGSIPGSVSAELFPYLEEVVIEAASSSLPKLVDRDSLRESLAEAVDPIDWTRPVSSADQIQQFREPPLQTVAKEHFDQNLRRHSENLLSATVQVLRERVPPNPVEQLAEGDLLACRWLLELDSRLDETTALARLALAKAAGDNMQPAKAIQYLPPDAVEILQRGNPWRGEYVHELLAMMNLRDHRFHVALQEMDAAIALLEKIGSEEEHIAVLKRMRALPLAELGRSKEAIAIHERAISELERSGMDRHPELELHRFRLAMARARSGEHEESLKVLLEKAESARGRMSDGVYRLDDLEVLNAYGFALLRARRFREAREVFADLLAASPLDGSDQFSLTIRANHANALMSLGDPQGASEFREVIERRTASLGEEHPQTLLARANLAQRLLESGIAGSLEELQEVFELQVASAADFEQLTVAALALIRSPSLSLEDAEEVAEKLARSASVDWKDEEFKAAAIRWVRDLRGLRVEESQESLLQAEAQRAHTAGDYARASDLYRELAARLTEGGGSELEVAGTKANALMMERPLLGQGVKSFGELETNGLKLIRSIDELIPVLTEVAGDRNGGTLSLRRTRALIQKDIRHLTGALTALREIVPLMEETDHRETLGAVSDLTALEAAQKLAHGALLRNVRTMLSSDPDGCLQVLSDAIDTLMSVGSLSNTDEEGLREEVRRLSVYSHISGPHFGRSVRRIASGLQSTVEEDYRR